VKTRQNLICAVFSGLLFALTWNTKLPAVSLFIAFVPFFFIIENTKNSRIAVFNYAFLTIILFHVGTVWWLAKSSFWGFLVIIISNSLYFAVAILLVFILRQNFGRTSGLFAFPVIWTSFEYIHFSWELSWPFMNLGNWLGQIHQWVQWYEFTGILGGTVWILILNVAVYQACYWFLKKRKTYSLISFTIGLFIGIGPYLVSKNLYQNYSEKSACLAFTCIQPNIDPYTEKYNSSLYPLQTKEQIQMAVQATGNPDCILFPESSFPAYLNEDSLNHHNLIKEIHSSLIKKSKTMVIGGLYSFRIKDGDTLFYNTAFCIDSSRPPLLRHKSKLVIGVEKMPFQEYFHFLKRWNLDFGGYTNSLTSDTSARNFESADKSFSLAPIICFESVYGQFVSGFVTNGATSIAVITNDAWWGDTPGYYQHLMHSKLRAIETRRNIARCANTGVSCIINGRGDITAQILPFEKNILKGNVSQQNYISFYTKHGDYIGIMALVSTVILIVFLAYRSIGRGGSGMNSNRLLKL
jgi:apolipoprotein N-acyltransferase